MSDSKDFVQKHLKANNGIVNVPDLLDQYAAEKDARIHELELVIEYAAECLDLTHPKDDNFEERLNAIYRNLENKTRYEI